MSQIRQLLYIVKNQIAVFDIYLYANQQGKVLHNSVSLEVGSHDNILNKSMRREYYKETVERKRKAQHAIVTKNYCLAKKNYQEFKRQTSMNENHDMCNGS